MAYSPPTPPITLDFVTTGYSAPVSPVTLAFTSAIPGTGTGSIAPVTVTAPEFGTNVTGSINNVTITTPEGTAFLSVNSSGSLTSVNVSAPEYGTIVSGSIDNITTIAPEGTAFLSVNSSGSIESVTVTAPTASAYTSLQVSGNLTSVSVISPTATASSTLNGVASGIIKAVNVSSTTSTGEINSSTYTAWLNDNTAIRCILVEVVVNVSDIETTRYLSTTGYLTSPDDSQQNIAYLPIINGGVKFTESIDLESKASLSFGDVELSNVNGQYDLWLDDVWVNREIKVYIGDVRWRRFDFRLIFDGIVDDIASKRRDVLNISIRDKLQRLNAPATDVVLGGTSINEEVLIPNTLGECFNVMPLVSDQATLEYQVHDGAIEDIIEVRDNGVPVLITKDLDNGKFTLNQSPAGTITASVQGDKPVTYEKTIAPLVENLAKNYGKVGEQFTDDDIDKANFSAFDIANPQPVGIYISSRINTLTAINQLAESVGAQAVMSRAGKLRLLKIELPPTGTPIELSARDMAESNLKISKRVPVRAAIKIGFCKTWAVQPDLQTGIPQEHKDYFEDEWIWRTSTNTAVATKYKLDVEPEQKDTLLLDDVDAETEAARLLELYETPRTFYSFDGYSNLIEFELGDTVTLTHDRFGLSEGATGMVTKLQIDWLTFKVKVEVIV